ncbi:MAG: hypothetical protein JWR83_558 [Aeromicrobium sp.]|nr:hypothetical protein [Aeromicrobium sp.]
MVDALHPRDRVPVVAAFASPLVSLPLLGPWVLNATVADDSPAKPHIGRAFDIHLFTTVIAIGLWLVSISFVGPVVAEFIGGGFVALSLVASFVLLVGILFNARWSAPWEPIVFGHRKFYHQAPFIG